MVLHALTFYIYRTFECIAMAHTKILIFPIALRLKLLASFILFSLPRLTLRLTPGLISHLLVTLLLISRCV